ncbi:hypothetical protein ACS127_05440 [Amphibacillus sp. Q70]|uniref:hypothetical protein n=1 Tax=Amphibacillus sp. Q70 TaxID=3453416 RepID=UPI003F879C2C
MKKSPRKLGDKHVYDVHKALTLSIKHTSIANFKKTVRETVQYIIELYPNIVSVTSKFEVTNTNVAKDLQLFLDDGTVKDVNLFLIKQNSKIQTKNLGAQSFFSKYFLSDNTQKAFNRKYENDHFEFLKNLAHTRENRVDTYDKKILKKIVSNHYPKFTDEIEQYRSLFLYQLRETAFSLLKDFYNDENKGFSHAYRTLFMTNDTTIITRYGKYEHSISVESFSPSSPYFTAIEIYKSGKHAVGIKYGATALTLRFKFESSPTSSIKLAVSYDTFPSETENKLSNKKTVRKMTSLINDHQYQPAGNPSHAIGKCHETLTYYYFLQYFPDISQVEPNECIHLMSKYYHIVKPDVLNDLYQSTSTIVPAIREKLFEKYSDYEIESIELVPDSYLENRLDTGDLKLILRVNKKYQVESISLKAIEKQNSKITTKNPGVGTILGPTYFNMGDLTPLVKSVKERFQAGELNHRESLEILAKELGNTLELASQNQLKQGIENLLGKAMIAVTFYRENISICKEHSRITSTIDVFVQTPTTIQNQLVWNNNTESINIRVKFSKSQKYGWSSVKLTSEYLVKSLSS